MNAWVKKTGKNFVHRTTEVAIQIGSDSWTRHELYTLNTDPEKCVGNFIAAGNLERALKKYKPKNLKELARRLDFDMLVSLDGVADTGRWVWCSLLHSRGINVVDWIDGKLMKPKKVRARKRRTRQVGKARVIPFAESA